MKRTLLSWSSGKDSAWSLHLLRATGAYEIVGLLTTFNGAADRVAMHGVRRSLVMAQAEATGLPLWDVDLPWPCSNDDYECAMRAVCQRALQVGVECIGFGDLFLTEIREYREKQLRGTGLQSVFPVWGIPTDALARDMIAAGLRAKLTCVDGNQIPLDLAGRDFDEQLLIATPLFTPGRCSGMRFRSSRVTLFFATSLRMQTSSLSNSQAVSTATVWVQASTLKVPVTSPERFTSRINPTFFTEGN